LLLVGGSLASFSAGGLFAILANIKNSISSINEGLGCRVPYNILI